MNHFFLLLWLADIVANIASITVLLTCLWIVVFMSLAALYGHIIENYEPDEKISSYIKIVTYSFFNALSNNNPHYGNC